MIKPGEIQKNATLYGVRDAQIEKDYVLSWMLKGISQHPDLSKEIVFKGGTVLKKIYFENYRFSEDLDFTLINPNITNQQIITWFEEVFKYIQDEAIIPLKQSAKAKVYLQSIFQKSLHKGYLNIKPDGRVH